MGRLLHYLPPAIFLVALVAFSLWWQQGTAEIEQDIELHGVRASAVVVDTHFARGHLMDIEFVYQGSRHHVEGLGVSTPGVAPGDSVTVSFLPNQPDAGILVRNRFFTAPRKSSAGWLDGHN